MILKFKANDEQVQTICRNDTSLAKLVKHIGEISLTVESNSFKSLAMSIIGQQISSKAAATIRGRVADLIPSFTPEALYALDPKLLKNAGLSYKKIVYIKDLSEKILDGRLDLKRLESLEDEEVIDCLCRLKGIGKWTAEMFLIFSLGRPDVLSLGDAGLQRAAKWLYQMDDRPDRNYLGAHSDKWTPIRSVVSLYLWRAIDRGLVDSGQSIDELYSNSSPEST